MPFGLGSRNKNISYCSTSCYKYVEDLIKEEKKVWIVSPFIDDYYVEYLLRHAKGKDVRIISSSIRKAAAKKLSGRPPLLSAIMFPVIILLFNYLLLRLDLLYPIILMISTLAIMFSIFSYLHGRGTSSVMLKIPKKFVHAKLYIGDNLAIEGSANLTFVGMHKNLEHIGMVSNPDDVDALKKQFLSMWSSLP